MTNQNNKKTVYSQQYQSSQTQNENTLRSVNALEQNQNKYDFEIANELDKRQKAYGQPVTQQYNAKKTNQASQMNQQQWNTQQRHDLEIANELGANYAANVARMNSNPPNRPTMATTQQLMSRNYNRLKSEFKQGRDVEFSVDLPNSNKSMKNQALPNNNTANQFARNKQPNYSNVDPETDSNRFEKGNN